MKQIAILFLIFFAQACSNGEKTAANPPSISPANARMTAEIEGMVCDKGCPKMIKTAVAKWGGVNTCTLDYEKRQIVIEYDSNSIQPAKMVEQFTTIGTGTYKIKVLSNEALSASKEEEIIITTPKSKEEREKEVDKVSV